jgi:hypothetical protein
MTSNSILAGAAVIAGAVALHGYWVSDQPRYQLSAAGQDGQTVWRIDTATGRLSMCGSIIPGNAFSQAQAQQDVAMLKLAQKPSADDQARVLQDAQNLSSVAATRCTEWSTE